MPGYRIQVSVVYEELATPVDGELRREPIADADAPCPRCGGRAWLLIERRAEPERPFTRWRALACAGCGAAEGWGSAGRARPGRAAPPPRNPRDELRALGLPEHPTVEDVCRAAPFPVFAPAAGTAKLLGTAYGAGVITEVTVAARGVEVSSRPVERSDPEWRARDRLEGLLEDKQTAPRSDAAWELHAADASRRARARAARPPAREAMIDVDGVPVAFVLVEDGGSWAAAADVAEHRVTISARRARIAGVALRTLPTG